MKLVILMLFSLVFQKAYGGHQTFTLKENDRISIKALLGDIEIVAQKDATATKISWSFIGGNENWRLTSFYGKQQLKIEVVGPNSKGDWIRSLGRSDSWPRLKLKIVGASRNLEVSLVKGQFKLQGWERPVDVVQQSGNLHISQTQGTLNLNLQEGDLLVTEHTGKLKIDSYSAEVKAAQIKGNVVAKNYSGSIQLKALQGQAYATSFKGPLDVQEVDGRLEFKISHGKVDLVGTKGILRGSTITGPVNLQVNSEVLVQVISKKGSVVLNTVESAAE